MLRKEIVAPKNKHRYSKLALRSDTKGQRRAEFGRSITRRRDGLWKREPEERGKSRAATLLVGAAIWIYGQESEMGTAVLS